MEFNRQQHFSVSLFLTLPSSKHFVPFKNTPTQVTGHGTFQTVKMEINQKG